MEIWLYVHALFVLEIFNLFASVVDHIQGVL